MHDTAFFKSTRVVQRVYRTIRPRSRPGRKGTSGPAARLEIQTTHAGEIKTKVSKVD